MCSWSRSSFGGNSVSFFTVMIHGQGLTQHHLQKLMIMIQAPNFTGRERWANCRKWDCDSTVIHSNTWTGEFRREVKQLLSAELPFNNQYVTVWMWVRILHVRSGSSHWIVEGLKNQSLNHMSPLNITWLLRFCPSITDTVTENTLVKVWEWGKRNCKNQN